jgi:uncharacterized membrane protein
MKSQRRIFSYLLLIALGAVLVILGGMETIDEFWSGMGGGLIGVSVVRLIQIYRLHKDPAYQEKMDIEINDERNRFLRAKAWSWAGYLFILISAAAVIVLKVMGQDLLSLAASWAVCLMLVLYWGSYLVLKKKY